MPNALNPVPIVKLIRCKVAADKGADFCVAQQAWQPLATCPGFRGQIGGWDRQNHDAVVIGLWQSKAHLTQFMAQLHDRIMEQNQQQNTYLSCKVQGLTPVSHQALSPALISRNKDHSPSAQGAQSAQLLQISQFNGVTRSDDLRLTLAAMGEALQKNRLGHGQAQLSSLYTQMWQGADDSNRHSNNGSDGSDGTSLLMFTHWHCAHAYEAHLKSSQYAQIQSRLNKLCSTVQESAIKRQPLWDVFPNQ